ncbi:MAG: methyltransferase domain-containing protein [Isosphaeraceae bacterium]
MGDSLVARSTHRHRTPELMDQPGLDPAAHTMALRGLHRINLVSRSAAIVWPALSRLSTDRRGPTRVLDLASGGGDVPIALARLAAGAGLDLRIDGCDTSPVAVDVSARNAELAGVSVHFFRLNVLEDPIPEAYDAVMCSLFLHHLDDDQAVRLLQRMAAAAGDLILVNDLLRSRMGYYLAWAGCRLLSRSPIVRHDGPASVEAAFNLAEAENLAGKAGLVGARLARHWPFRFLLSWSR